MINSTTYQERGSLDWKGILVPGLIAAGCFWLLWLFLSLLRFEFLQSDALGYWQDSLEWQHPFNTYHVPLFPLLIALGRGLTFDRLPPAALTLGITFLAFVAGSVLAYKIFRLDDRCARYATPGMLLFSFWPFVLADSMVLGADMLAITLVLGGLYALLRSQPSVSGLVFGLALVTHKAMWPVVGLIVAAWVVWSWRNSRRVPWRFFVVLLIPIGLLWIGGSIYHGTPTWILQSNLRVEVASRSTLPVLDGILGGLSGGISAIFKAGIVVIVAAISLALMVISFRSSSLVSWLGAAVAGAVLLLCLTLNHYEIWASVRFSKMLVLPLIWGLSAWRPQIIESKLAWRAVLVGAVLSQFAFAWYMARVFYA